ncbi:MAG: fumarate reductase/succinate dehydrogenase flavoprotein subunit [Acidimicrobiia bacterium]|nr:fumarate reductase/succinate dehydrogenase flavoprotein subunit [Acidimicrobiia bacterium]
MTTQHSPNPGSPALDPKIPPGPIQDRWDDHKFSVKLVNPANKRKYDIIVIGTGLAGASAAASFGELGYNVKVFTHNDSARRGHSIAAQGGINAAKNYRNDGDSIYRLFYDTVKGGDFRSRETNVYRLAQVSNEIIDQTVAQGVPYAREYGGLLDNRSFGGAQVSRTFYARGQTGQQLLLGAYQALMRQVEIGPVELYTRSEMLEVAVKDGRAVGVVVRDLVTGEITAHSAHAVVLATGGYSNVYFLSTNAMNCNATAVWRAHRKGAYFANPCFTQIHPTCIPASDEHQSKLTLMSESLRNDGRIWVPVDPDDRRAPNDIPEDERDYYLERQYPAFGNLVPRDVASRAAMRMIEQNRGIGPLKNGVYLDFGEAIGRLGRAKIEERYGNLFEMYERITDEDPYEVPMRIYPAPHYTMGGLWVDYNLMTTVPGLYAIGEANFSDHGANRLGASALMQGLADGYFVIPNTINDYLSDYLNTKPVPTDDEVFMQAVAQVREREQQFLDINGTRSVDYFHRRLGHLMIDYCGLARSREGLEKAIAEIQALKEEFWRDLKVLGTNDSLNQSLERAGRVADFLELAELMCRDALDREESCGGHFRVEHQTEDGEAKRDDEDYAFVSAWEWVDSATPQALHKEPLTFEYVPPSQRSYK